MPTVTVQEDARSKARSEFTRIIRDRIEYALGRGDPRTTTIKLAADYEDLHKKGWPYQHISTTVRSIIENAKYRGKLYYARNDVTGFAERAEPGKSAPMWIYLRSDAVVPTGFTLVPMNVTDKAKIAEYVTQAKGGNPKVIVTKPEIVEVAKPAAKVDWESLAKSLLVVVKQQADLITSLSESVVSIEDLPDVKVAV